MPYVRAPFVATAVTCLSLVSAAGAQPGAAPAAGPLEAFWGTWVIEAEWSWGGSLRAWTSYEPVLDGRWTLARTVASDDGGEPYLRYIALFRALDDGLVAQHSFDFNGAVRTTQLRAEEVDGRQVFSSEWSMDGAQVRDRFGMTADGRIAWTVQMQPPGAEGFTTVLDDRWERCEASDVPQVGTPALVDELADLGPLTGAWAATVDRAGTVWGQRNTPVLGGRFVESVSWEVRPDGREAQLRYSLFGVDADAGELAQWLFTPAASEPRVFVVKPREGALVMTDDREGRVASDSTLTFRGPNRFRQLMRWKPLGSEEWNELPGISWNRTAGGDSMPSPIEVEPFVADGMDLRRFVKTAAIDAPVERVYAAWASGDGFLEAFAPGNETMAANIDLAIGGRYEWLFDGKVGGNGCQVLSYVPNRMISFTWIAPPGQATRSQKTWVVVETDPRDDGGTDLTLTHLGFGEGEAWDQTYAYFDGAWSYVLDVMKKNLEAAGG